MLLQSIQKTVLPVFYSLLFIIFIPSNTLAQVVSDQSGVQKESGHEHKEISKEDPTVGLVEHIGATIPLDITFKDEEGKTVTLGQLVKGPTIIAPVYYRCPNVCNFLQGSLSAVLPNIKRKPGKEYQVISISFDEKETPELAAQSKAMYFQAMKKKFPAEAWRFLTGDIGSIRQLTDAAGYSFRRMEDGEFLHPVVIFVVDSKGTIVRYLHGTHYLPKDITLALVEASEGRLGTTIQKVVRFCFSYEAENKTYVFNILRVTGTVVLLTAVSFMAFLILGGKKRKKGTDHG